MGARGFVGKDFGVCLFEGRLFNMVVYGACTVFNIYLIVRILLKLTRRINQLVFPSKFYLEDNQTSLAHPRYCTWKERCIRNLIQPNNCN